MAAELFTKTPGWLDYQSNPSHPLFQLPSGAVDAHCHVFGPGDTFPYASKRRYTPCDAPKEALFALRDHLGFDKNVIVQASCHGTDNRALIDALQTAGGHARGVAVVNSDVTDTELQTMHESGVRAVRFNFLPRLVDSPDLDAFAKLAQRISAYGWHVVVYLEIRQLPELYDFLVNLPTIVVIDHLGRIDVTKGRDSGEFRSFVGLLRDHSHIWCKVSCPERLSQSGPPAIRDPQQTYLDVIPFARQLIETFPTRVLWGTDWPHPNLRDHMPDDGRLVDYVQQIAVTVTLQQRLLVDNPMSLYWNDAASRTVND